MLEGQLQLVGILQPPDVGEMFTLYAYSRIRSTAREQTLSAAQNAFDSSAASVQQALDRLRSRGAFPGIPWA